MGDLVGNFVGNFDGNFVGSLEGILVGDFEGNFVGVLEGGLVGNFDGILVGNVEGFPDGLGVAEYIMNSDTLRPNQISSYHKQRLLRRPLSPLQCVALTS